MSSVQHTNTNFVCEYCSSVFASPKSLDNHKKIAKYCLSIQGKINEKFKCTGCEKFFTTNTWLYQHEKLCVDFQVKNQTKEFIDKIKMLEKSIEQLTREKDNIIRENSQIIREKDQIIKDLAEKAISNAKPIVNNTTNNTTNNTINNLQIISDDHIKAQAKHLTIDHIKRGALGYSEYFLEYPLKERVACTDYARRKLKYKNENGEIVTDPEMTNLAERLFQSIKDRNKELTIQYTRELTDKYKDEKGAIEISHFMDLATKFSEQDLEVFKMFNGDKNDFFHDILRHICSKTLI